MPQGFIGENGGGVGKVQTAGAGEHRQAQAALSMRGQKGFVESFGFLAEKKKTAVAESGLVIRPGPFG